ncbi:MAG: very short patch repair endonuclease [Patescibacteria group bacterium]
MDNVSKKRRSEIMGLVKSKETKMEVAFRKELSSRGLRYRKNSVSYLGKPDIVFKKNKLVIFLDSCFWHGCKKHLRIPTRHKKYWVAKINRNKKRDFEVSRHYKKLGWKIVRAWEHKIKKDRSALVNKILGVLKK